MAACLSSNLLMMAACFCSKKVRTGVASTPNTPSPMMVSGRLDSTSSRCFLCCANTLKDWGETVSFLGNATPLRGCLQLFVKNTSFKTRFLFGRTGVSNKAANDIFITLDNGKIPDDKWRCEGGDGELNTHTHDEPSKHLYLLVRSSA